jgi:hypothetical protein
MRGIQALQLSGRQVIGDHVHGVPSRNQQGQAPRLAGRI